MSSTQIVLSILNKPTFAVPMVISYLLRAEPNIQQVETNHTNYNHTHTSQSHLTLDTNTHLIEVLVATTVVHLLVSTLICVVVLSFVPIVVLVL